PATRKKNAISPELTQPCRSSATPAPPIRTDSTVSQQVRYEDGSAFDQTSAAIVAASKTAALPVSVRRNWRRGVWRLRSHAVRSESGAAGSPEAVTFRSSPARRLPPTTLYPPPARPPCTVPCTAPAQV